jgi:hypothetical protein
MRSKLCVSIFATVVALAPVATFAQQMPVPPDGTSMNEPPAAGNPSTTAADLCGTTPAEAFGQTGPDGMPTQPALNPEDITAVQPVNLSSVTGLVMHGEGNLVLLSIPRIPAMGTANPVPPTPDKTMAVVRLPSNCRQMPTEGSKVTAIGLPSPDGILNAQLVQNTD